MDFLGNGLGPGKDGDRSPSLVAFPAEVYESPLLDLTVATLDIELVPAKPGHAPRMSISRWVIELVAGTQTTPLTFRAGGNAARTDFIPLTATNPANADVNSANPPSLGATIAAVIGIMLNANTPIMMDVVSGAQGTGGFALRGRFYTYVVWEAIS